MLKEITKENYNKIKIGDTVICNTSFDGFPKKGWKGKVILKTTEYELGLGIEWEKEFELGHSCRKNGKEYKCRWYGNEKSHLEETRIDKISLLTEEQLEFEF